MRKGGLKNKIMGLEAENYKLRQISNQRLKEISEKKESLYEAENSIELLLKEN